MFGACRSFANQSSFLIPLIKYGNLPDSIKNIRHPNDQMSHFASNHPFHTSGAIVMGVPETIPE